MKNRTLTQKQALEALLEICEWAKLDYPETWKAILRESYGMKGEVYSEIADQKHLLSKNRMEKARQVLALNEPPAKESPVRETPAGISFRF